ncbi:MAG: Ribosomal small subunit methyltransferase [Pseudomonadota bacterium]
MSLRLYLDVELSAGLNLSLPTGAARHVQVLRLQPGDQVTLFNGLGGEWQAEIVHMGRSEVTVVVRDHAAVERELAHSVTLAVCMPANDRFDWLIEKATELGAAAVQPLVSERSVLRVAGERAEKKRAHWQGIAAAAAEQCGRNRLPLVHPVHELEGWLRSAPFAPACNAHVLSLRPGAGLASLLAAAAAAPPCHWLLLSGPEGGLSAREEDLAVSLGYAPLSLGPRVLRAETAPLALLAVLAAL